MLREELTAGPDEKHEVFRKESKPGPNGQQVERCSENTIPVEN
jgi:hypothetical protein